VRVECESCRELVVASFAIDGDTVRTTCPACHHLMTTPGATGAAPRDAPVAAPGAAPVDAAGDMPGAGDASSEASLCPKCGAVRGEAVACPGCGLAVARMAEYTEARDAAVPEPLRDAWTRATEGWTDAAPHDELLRLVAANNCYAWAAGRYRTRARDAVAQRQLERLRRAAEAALFASATARPDATAKPYRSTRSVLVILIVTIAAGLLYATVIRDRAPASSATSTPVRPLTPGHPVSPSTIK
jgi:uncharacterized Zn finger protein (UPF0148 family)